MLSKRPFWATELGKRIVSGIVMVVLAIVAAYEGGWPFASFWLLAGLAVLVEFLHMSGVFSKRLMVALSLCLGVLALSRLHEQALLIGFASVVAALLCCLLLAGNNRDRLWAFAGFAVAAILIKVPVLMRDHPDFGLIALLWMFAVVWTTDIAAFFTGRSLGGPKLWPSISPKKTWSGFCGGLLGGAGAGLALVWAFNPSILASSSLILIGVLSIAASLATQAGDLAESAMKRHFNVKDAGRLIPGHGGVMDRLDGFFAVAALLGLVMAAGRLI